MNLACNEHPVLCWKDTLVEITPTPALLTPVLFRVGFFRTLDSEERTCSTNMLNFPNLFLTERWKTMRALKSRR